MRWQEPGHPKCRKRISLTLYVSPGHGPRNRVHLDMCGDVHRPVWDGGECATCLIPHQSAVRKSVCLQRRYAIVNRESRAS